MAAATVGGAFLSAFLDVVFDRLASPEVANLIRGKKLDRKLLRRLETTLKVVIAVLDDAEKKQITDSNVKSWLDDLKDAVYFADDLLDEVSTKAATQKEEKVSTLFSHLNIFNVQDRVMGRVATELEGIVERLESILQLKNSLDLKVDIAMENNMSYRTQSTPLVDEEFQIYGRDKDKEAVMKLLLDVSDDKKLSVIPIVGMGGVGKTTLAQLIYNDDNLKQMFDFQAWVCVSEEFDIVKVTKAIINENASEMNDLSSLQLDLQDKLKGKKFLIVLDDVWIEEYGRWRHFEKPFQHGIRGSKILITTRNDKVANVVKTGQVDYHLNPLSNQDCWLVFANHACLSSESTENRKALEKIGQEIVRNCKGLPLAAQSLGGMLRSKRDIKDWKNILNSDIWDLSERESMIIPALRVSYNYLPPHLKRCFVYCSLFPKDYEFDKKDLILLWMAEDLLSPKKKGKTLEEVGEEYFGELTSRSFFQRSSNWKETEVFVMHDLMHDLATSLGGEFYLRLEELGRETKISGKTRHLSSSKFNDSISENFEVFSRLKCLRTYLPVHYYQHSLDNECAVHILKIKTLRVFSFSYFESLKVLPDSIGELIHLRYLNLSDTGINTLPESFGNLSNLQTLLLRNCFELTMLPDSIQNLVSLRNLDIHSTFLKEMPKGMGKLNQLQGLDYFIVGKHEDNGIKELGYLSNLHGSLTIKKLEHITDSSQAMGARMMDKKHINRLSLKWSSTSGDCVDSQTEKDILCELQPHQDLESLHIKGYKGTRFPDWFGYSSYHNMKDLKLSSCSNCCMLPSLGQLPSLKTLKISGLNGLEKIDASFYKNGDSYSGKPFPSLQFLKFSNMPNWVVWTPFGSDAFPLLECLEIIGCPKLKGGCMLPSLGQLPCLKTLQFLFLDGLEKIDANFYKNDYSYSEKPFPYLQSLEFSYMPNWVVWTTFGSDAFPRLEHLVIRDCPKLKGDLPHHLPALKKLEIVDCQQIASSLPHHLPALKKLAIQNCPQIASSLPRAPTVSQSENIESNKLPWQELPHSIEHISIKGNPMLVDSMFEILANTQPTCLRSLGLFDSTSKFLSVSSRHEMQLQRHSPVVSCGSISLISLPLDIFQNPKTLSIRHSENLESLYVSGSHSLQNLTSLEIGACRNFVSFPREGLQAPNLIHLVISGCDKLKSLPHPMNALLPKLESLGIYDCPEVEPFLEGSMPPDMREMNIANCEKLLGGLALPKKGLLPPSLTCLRLFDFSSMETLDCNELLHLTSLQILAIFRCPKLENMEGDRLPASLRLLSIKDCPLMQERCRTKHPQIWPKIAHIPDIYW